MAKRHVSFAPEVTLYTGDGIEDDTTVTESSESTRRTSDLTRSSNSQKVKEIANVNRGVLGHAGFSVTNP